MECEDVRVEGESMEGVRVEGESMEEDKDCITGN